MFGRNSRREQALEAQQQGLSAYARWFYRDLFRGTLKAILLVVGGILLFKNREKADEYIDRIKVALTTPHSKS